MTRIKFYRRVESLCSKNYDRLDVYIVDDHRQEVSVNIDWSATYSKNAPGLSIDKVVESVRMRMKTCKGYRHCYGLGGKNAIFYTPLDETHVRVLELICYDVSKLVKELAIS